MMRSKGKLPMDERAPLIEGEQDMAKILITALGDSGNKFPIDFDFVWTFLGYSSKGNASRKLTGKFEEGVDFLLETYPARSQSGGGAPLKRYRLTPDAFERFALSTESERGTLVRDFFVTLKKKYFHTLDNVYQQSPEALIDESKRFLEGEHKKLACTIIGRPPGAERVVQCCLCELEGGVLEVPCKYGQVDLVTATEVIEVKSMSKWKHALGQVLAYSTCFPKHRARIHLYKDEAQGPDLSDIIEVCSRVGIRVTFHQSTLPQ